MFDLTDEAARLIQMLIDSADMHTGSGLRMSLEPPVGSLIMSLVTHPAPADTVFTTGNAHVFVTRAAATRLNAQILDAHITSDRRAFFLRDR